MISLHRGDKGFYPDEPDNKINMNPGRPSNVGTGKGRGFTVNIAWGWHETTPVTYPRPGDAEYITAFSNVVLPILSEFDPELIIISSGFDACEGDPLGCCHLTPVGYRALTACLAALDPPRGILAVLEGGYNLDSIAAASVEVTRALVELGPTSRRTEVCQRVLSEYAQSTGGSHPFGGSSLHSGEEESGSTKLLRSQHHSIHSARSMLRSTLKSQSNQELPVTSHSYERPPLSPTAYAANSSALALSQGSAPWAGEESEAVTRPYTSSAEAKVQSSPTAKGVDEASTCDVLKQTADESSQHVIPSAERSSRDLGLSDQNSTQAVGTDLGQGGYGGKVVSSWEDSDWLRTDEGKQASTGATSSQHKQETTPVLKSGVVVLKKDATALTGEPDDSVIPSVVFPVALELLEPIPFDASEASATEDTDYKATIQEGTDADDMSMQGRGISESTAAHGSQQQYGLLSSQSASSMGLHKGARGLYSHPSTPTRVGASSLAATPLAQDASTHLDSDDYESANYYANLGSNMNAMPQKVPYSPFTKQSPYQRLVQESQQQFLDEAPPFPHALPSLHPLVWPPSVRNIPPLAPSITSYPALHLSPMCLEALHRTAQAQAPYWKCMALLHKQGLFSPVPQQTNPQSDIPTPAYAHGQAEHHLQSHSTILGEPPAPPQVHTHTLRTIPISLFAFVPVLIGKNGAPLASNELIEGSDVGGVLASAISGLPFVVPSRASAASDAGGTSARSSHKPPVPIPSSSYTSVRTPRKDAIVEEGGIAAGIGAELSSLAVVDKDDDTDTEVAAADAQSPATAALFATRPKQKFGLVTPKSKIAEVGYSSKSGVLSHPYGLSFGWKCVDLGAKLTVEIETVYETREIHPAPTKETTHIPVATTTARGPVLASLTIPKESDDASSTNRSGEEGENGESDSSCVSGGYSPPVTRFRNNRTKLNSAMGDALTSSTYSIGSSNVPSLPVIKEVVPTHHVQQIQLLFIRIRDSWGRVHTSIAITDTLFLESLKHERIYRLPRSSPNDLPFHASTRKDGVETPTNLVASNVYPAVAISGGAFSTSGASHSPHSTTAPSSSLALTAGTDSKKPVPSSPSSQRVRTRSSAYSTPTRSSLTSTARAPGSVNGIGSSVTGVIAYSPIVASSVKHTPKRTYMSSLTPTSSAAYSPFSAGESVSAGGRNGTRNRKSVLHLPSGYDMHALSEGEKLSIHNQLLLQEAFSSPAHPSHPVSTPASPMGAPPDMGGGARLTTGRRGRSSDDASDGGAEHIVDGPAEGFVDGSGMEGSAEGVGLKDRERSRESTRGVSPPPRVTRYKSASTFRDAPLQRDARDVETEAASPMAAMAGQASPSTILWRPKTTTGNGAGADMDADMDDDASTQRNRLAPALGPSLDAHSSAIPKERTGDEEETSSAVSGADEMACIDDNVSAAGGSLSGYVSGLTSGLASGSAAGSVTGFALDPMEGPSSIGSMISLTDGDGLSRSPAMLELATEQSSAELPSETQHNTGLPPLAPRPPRPTAVRPVLASPPLDNAAADAADTNRTQGAPGSHCDIAEAGTCVSVGAMETSATEATSADSSRTSGFSAPSEVPSDSETASRTSLTGSPLPSSAIDTPTLPNAFSSMTPTSTTATTTPSPALASGGSLRDTDTPLSDLYAASPAPIVPTPVALVASSQSALPPSPRIDKLPIAELASERKHPLPPHAQPTPYTSHAQLPMHTAVTSALSHTPIKSSIYLEGISPPYCPPPESLSIRSEATILSVFGSTEPQTILGTALHTNFFGPVLETGYVPLFNSDSPKRETDTTTTTGSDGIATQAAGVVAGRENDEVAASSQHHLTTGYDSNISTLSDSDTRSELRSEAPCRHVMVVRDVSGLKPFLSPAYLFDKLALGEALSHQLFRSFHVISACELPLSITSRPDFNEQQRPIQLRNPLKSSTGIANVPISSTGSTATPPSSTTIAPYQEPGIPTRSPTCRAINALAWASDWHAWILQWNTLAQHCHTVCRQHRSLRRELLSEASATSSPVFPVPGSSSGVSASGWPPSSPHSGDTRLTPHHAPGSAASPGPLGAELRLADAQRGARLATPSPLQGRQRSTDSSCMDTVKTQPTFGAAHSSTTATTPPRSQGTPVPDGSHGPDTDSPTGTSPLDVPPLRIPPLRATQSTEEPVGMASSSRKSPLHAHPHLQPLRSPVSSSTHGLRSASFHHTPPHTPPHAPHTQTHLHAYGSPLRPASLRALGAGSSLSTTSSPRSSMGLHPSAAPCANPSHCLSLSRGLVFPATPTPFTLETSPTFAYAVGFSRTHIRSSGGKNVGRDRLSNLISRCIAQLKAESASATASAVSLPYASAATTGSVARSPPFEAETYPSRPTKKLVNKKLGSRYTPTFHALDEPSPQPSPLRLAPSLLSLPPSAAAAAQAEGGTLSSSSSSSSSLALQGTEGRKDGAETRQSLRNRGQKHPRSLSLSDATVPSAPKQQTTPMSLLAKHRAAAYGSAGPFDKLRDGASAVDGRMDATSAATGAATGATRGGKASVSTADKAAAGMDAGVCVHSSGSGPGSEEGTAGDTVDASLESGTSAGLLKAAASADQKWQPLSYAPATATPMPTGSSMLPVINPASSALANTTPVGGGGGVSMQGIVQGTQQPDVSTGTAGAAEGVVSNAPSPLSFPFPTTQQQQQLQQNLLQQQYHLQQLQQQQLQQQQQQMRSSTPLAPTPTSTPMFPAAQAGPAASALPLFALPPAGQMPFPMIPGMLPFQQRLRSDSTGGGGGGEAGTDAAASGVGGAGSGSNASVTGNGSGGSASSIENLLWLQQHLAAQNMYQMFNSNLPASFSQQAMQQFLGNPMQFQNKVFPSSAQPQPTSQFPQQQPQGLSPPLLSALRPASTQPGSQTGSQTSSQPDNASGTSASSVSSISSLASLSSPSSLSSPQAFHTRLTKKDATTTINTSTAKDEEREDCPASGNKGDGSSGQRQSTTTATTATEGSTGSVGNSKPSTQSPPLVAQERRPSISSASSVDSNSTQEMWRIFTQNLQQQISRQQQNQHNLLFQSLLLLQQQQYQQQLQQMRMQGQQSPPLGTASQSTTPMTSPPLGPVATEGNNNAGSKSGGNGNGVSRSEEATARDASSPPNTANNDVADPSNAQGSTGKAKSSPESEGFGGLAKKRLREALDTRYDIQEELEGKLQNNAVQTRNSSIDSTTAQLPSAGSQTSPGGGKDGTGTVPGRDKDLAIATDLQSPSIISSPQYHPMQSGQNAPSPLFQVAGSQSYGRRRLHSPLLSTLGARQLPGDTETLSNSTPLQKDCRNTGARNDSFAEIAPLTLGPSAMPPSSTAQDAKSPSTEL